LILIISEISCNDRDDDHRGNDRGGAVVVLIAFPRLGSWGVATKRMRMSDENENDDDDGNINQNDNDTHTKRHWAISRYDIDGYM